MSQCTARNFVQAVNLGSGCNHVLFVQQDGEPRAQDGCIGNPLPFEGHRLLQCSVRHYMRLAPRRMQARLQHVRQSVCRVAKDNRWLVRATPKPGLLPCLHC